MPFIMQRNGDGELLREADGDLIGDCGCCGVVPACSDPLLDVTLTWTDADLTKSYMGETFTNGQTHAICPSQYNCFVNKDSRTITTGGGQVKYIKGTHKNEAWVRSNGAGEAEVCVQDSRGSSGSLQYTSSYNTSKVIDRIALGIGYRDALTILDPSVTPIFRTTNTTTEHSERIAGIGTEGTFKARSKAETVFTYATYTVTAYSRQNFQNLAPDCADRARIAPRGGILTPAFFGDVTTSSGITIAWVENNTGVQWHDPDIVINGVPQ